MVNGVMDPKLVDVVGLRLAISSHAKKLGGYVTFRHTSLDEAGVDNKFIAKINVLTAAYEALQVYGQNDKEMNLYKENIAALENAKRVNPRYTEALMKSTTALLVKQAELVISIINQDTINLIHQNALKQAIQTTKASSSAGSQNLSAEGNSRSSILNQG